MKKEKRIKDSALTFSRTRPTVVEKLKKLPRYLKSLQDQKNQPM